MVGSQMMKRDRIAGRLRVLILSDQLPRGARLRQDELARRFEASITPVREALRQLEAEGLLVSEPHRGVRVAGVDLQKVEATYVVRRLVESYAMRRAVTRLSALDLRQTRSLIDRMQAESDAGNVDAFRVHNREFHFYFYQRCGMPALTEQIDSLWQAFPWDLMLTTPERIRQSQCEHADIQRAVERRDVAAVAAATEAHIGHVFTAIARRLGGSDDGGRVSDPFGLDIDRPTPRP